MMIYELVEKLQAMDQRNNALVLIDGEHITITKLTPQPDGDGEVQPIDDCGQAVEPGAAIICIE